MRLAIVTATIDLERASPCLASWRAQADAPPPIYVVEQGHGFRDWEGTPTGYRLGVREILGVVPAFARGVQQALHDGAEIIACFHDDLLIEDASWDDQVRTLFETFPGVGLVGFGGAPGLGDANIYQVPYNPMQLARQGFRSNMRHAEAHGVRSHVIERITVLDGFSQIGRREFWKGLGVDRPGVTCTNCNAVGFGASAEAPRMCLFCDGTAGGNPPQSDLFSLMQSWGLIHHAYDAALGCFAARLGWEVLYVPVGCHHHGGLTAVADPRYHAWAKTQAPGGDAEFWARAHEIVYHEFRDVLPLRVAR